MPELEVGKTYKILIPAVTTKGLEFNETIKTYKVVDKEKNFDKMMPHQQELSFLDKYYAVEDEYGKIVLIEIKKDYEVKEIKEEV